MKSLRTQLESVGIEVIGAEETLIKEDMNPEEYEAFEVDSEVGAVIFGIDMSFTMAKLQIAALYINEGKVPLIATNNDACVNIKGMRYPSTGAQLESLLAATNLKSPDSTSNSEGSEKTYSLIGKPNPYTIDYIRKCHPDIDTERMIMIGDRPDTDIQFGKNAGIKTCLVLTGVVHSIQDFYTDEKWKDAAKPDFIMHSFGDKICSEGSNNI